MGSYLSSLDPEERSLRARLAAYAKHAKTNGSEVTASARAASPGSDDYWLTKVDPDRRLAEPERRKRARAAKKEHFIRLSLLSKQSRSRSRDASRDGDSDVR